MKERRGRRKIRNAPKVLFPYLRDDRLSRVDNSREPDLDIFGFPERHQDGTVRSKSKGRGGIDTSVLGAYICDGKSALGRSCINGTDQTCQLQRTWGSPGEVRGWSFPVCWALVILSSTTRTGLHLGVLSTLLRGLDLYLLPKKGSREAKRRLVNPVDFQLHRFWSRLTFFHPHPDRKVRWVLEQRRQELFFEGGRTVSLLILVVADTVLPSSRDLMILCLVESRSCTRVVSCVTEFAGNLLPTNASLTNCPLVGIGVLNERLWQNWTPGW